MGKHLCWNLFLIKRDTNIGAFLLYCEIFYKTYFEEPLRTAPSKEYVIPVTNSD